MDRRQFLTMSLSLAAGATLSSCGGDANVSSVAEAEPAGPDPAGSTSSGSTPTGLTPTTVTGQPVTPPAAAPVPDALQFSAALVGGGTFDGAAYAGTPLALWFWAPT